ncbi:MAG: hypothetical protein KJO04_00200 [Bacteroidia bacterium]|nr:hypothetical protein [Bacteroidia bacterium]
MLFKRLELEEILRNIKSRSQNAEQLLTNVKSWLEADLKRDVRIESTLSTGRPADSNSFVFDLLDADKIYHINHIKTICIDYRLRFLDTKYFKSEIPDAAKQKIKELETAHSADLKGFKIMAPSRMFKLEDKNDPMLFAPIGNGYFYLIHKWGRDLHPLRKWVVWPLKNMVNLLFIILLISFLSTLVVPEGLFSKQGSTAEFLIIFFFVFKSIIAVVLFYGISLGKNFNPAIWNSKYFNA